MQPTESHIVLWWNYSYTSQCLGATVTKEEEEELEEETTKA